MGEFLDSHRKTRWFIKRFLPLAIIVGVFVYFNDYLEPLLDVIPRFTLIMFVIPMVEEFISKLLNRFFPEPNSLLDESKIEISLGEVKYDGDTQVEFIIKNHNAQSTDRSQILLSVKGESNQAKLGWYWQGTTDRGESTEKHVELIHLENEYPHKTLLKIRRDPKVKKIVFQNDKRINSISIPISATLDVTISVFGLNHKRRDEFFTIESTQKRLDIRKSSSLS